jgi:CHASE3 domain sensor protein
MTPDTGLGISLAAVGLWLAQRKYIRVARCLGICLLGLACFNLLNRNVAGGAVSHLFFQPLDVSYMAPATIVVLLLLGIELLFIGRVGASLRVSWVVAALGTTVFSIGFVTVIGYASVMNTAPWWGNFVLKMALPTAAASCALGIATIATPFQSVSKGRQQLSLTLAVSATFGLLLLLAGLAAVWTSLNAVAIALAEVRTTSDEIRSIGALVNDVRQAETGQRDYLLTEDRRYLQEFQLGQQGFQQVVSNGGGHNAALLKIIQLKFDELNLAISLEEHGGREAALSLVKSSRGMNLMEEIETRVRLAADQLQTTLVH